MQFVIRVPTGQLGDLARQYCAWWPESDGPAVLTDWIDPADELLFYCYVMGGRQFLLDRLREYA